MAPWLAVLDPFRYHYRPLEENQIRVLRLLPPSKVSGSSPDSTIECKIIHVLLSDWTPYEALSYAWGSNALTKTIHVKGSGRHFRSGTIRITESLWAALIHLRKASESRDLWIDQLCINQNDKAEKSVQVNRMGEVYSKSTSTVIWLGPQDNRDAILLNELYGKLSRGGGDIDTRGLLTMDQRTLVALIGTSTQQEHEDRMIYAYRRLLERFLALPWFSRAWVYQEAVLAESVIVVWGNIFLPFDFITGLLVSVYGLAKGSPDDQEWHKRIKNTPGFAPLRAIYHDRNAHREGQLNFLHVLWHARKHLSAGDNRDYVYAFRGVNKHIDDKPSQPNTRIQDQIVPDYKDSATSTVYTDLALITIRTTNTLGILDYIVPTKPTQDPPRDPLQDTSSLPSWVPNWSNRNFQCGGPIFDPQIPWPTSACSWKPWTPRLSPSRNELPVSGYIISRVESIIDHRFQHTYFSSTLKTALGLENLVALLKEAVGNLHQAPEWSSKHKIRETALSTILANGAFTLTHQLQYPIRDLLQAYDSEGVITSNDQEDVEPLAAYMGISSQKEKDEKLRRYLRQSGEMATGKRVFLTQGLDIGLGYATVKKGDLEKGLRHGCVVYDAAQQAIQRHRRSL
ncbi:heterokaryon incompatibility protein-domain-containing protein [Cercophora newfieldiana]|uniref:Heterokaryon incompatibility protein-domain-containing protein n=1 Tax=Cercophora newfieldiana TaxID=92897 RepID=A0AA39Y9M2_9PEZI|nr:heterokaryon incompatibility protein-domain-containing protein [Cercophora newfieldiana]